ncbi:hypothetical protein Salat_2677500 [Sesamum alatum]|uniref:Uncharacterized protein n=1 Tax=Sesamum alatum TaxID=300844 RepID=A0AAE2CB76_9LAMI|nr:hypothetical protein Salat_2677500 [Sesamum alatum]
MAESRPDPSSNTLSGKDVNSLNVFERAKEEIVAVLNHEKNRNHHHKETHGLREDIDVDTPMSDVKAPNVFERAKEEIEALVEAFHAKKESSGDGSPSYGETRDSGGKDSLKSKKLDSYSHHHKETHGLRDDIDVDTPMSDVKAPNVFERAKEEIEALVEAIHAKMESKSDGSPLYGETRDNGAKDSLKSKNSDSDSEKHVKAPNLTVKAKEEKSPKHKPHHKETHGLSDDIDENTPISQVKGPSVFERAKEEIEALIETIHSKKDSGDR